MFLLLLTTAWQLFYAGSLRPLWQLAMDALLRPGVKDSSCYHVEIHE
jgi:hypothetical protein